MSFGSSNDAKEQVRQATDIVDLVSSYLDLRRQGRNYVALCPWHDDSHPSLQVNPARQSWKCWVCGIGGDVFSFVMQREGVEFREALQMLADRAGIPLVGQHKGSATGGPADKRTLYQAMGWAEKQYHECLMRAANAEVARQYLTQRGIDRDSMERFRLGYSPDGWQWILDRARSTPFSPAVLEAVGLVVKSDKTGSYHDRFRGRLLFPIRDVQSRPVALGGRILPELARQQEAEKGHSPPKYINSPESRIFSKSEQLYGLDAARDVITKSRHVVVVEGYTDVVVAHQHGVCDVVAVLGTALGLRHIQLLRRFSDSVTLVLDGDEAGRSRANEVLELFVAAQVDLRVLTLPQGLDPCDYVLQQGGEAFRNLLASAVDALEHRILNATQDVDPVRDTHRAHEAIEQVLATLAKASRQASSSAHSSQIREHQILTRLARVFRVDAAPLRARLLELRRGARPKTPAVSPAARREKISSRQLSPAEAALFELLTQEPQLAHRAAERVSPECLPTEAGRALWQAYKRLMADQQPLDFSRVLTSVDEPMLKNILVELDETGAAKAPHRHHDAATELEEVLNSLYQRAFQSQGREQVAALEEKRYPENEELDILEQLLRTQRQRQGISAPTDG